MIIPNKLLKYPVDVLTYALEVYAMKGDSTAVKATNLKKDELLELVKANRAYVLTKKEELFRERLFASMQDLHNKIRFLTEEVDEASPQDINALASAFEKIHRIYALLGGQPSEIIEERKFEHNMIASFNVHEIADSLKEEIGEWLQISQEVALRKSKP